MMKEKIALLSIFINLVLAIGKTLVGFFIGSASVLAEGFHSGMDVFSSGIGFLGIRISKKPVDKKHPYGHYKFEVLSGLIITILLFVTGLWIIYKAYIGFLNPDFVSLSYLAMIVMLASVVLNEITARLKIYYGKKENSLSLLSDGVHDRVDVFASIAVLVGLFIVPYWIYVDSILALLVGVYIIWESFKLGREATDSLLDVSASDGDEEKIREIVSGYNVEIFDLRTQKKGSVITANLGIKLSNKVSVEEATEISRKIKKSLIDGIEFLEYVVIQIEGHDVTDSYFEPKEFVSKISFGGGFGWQRKGKFKDNVEGAVGLGPEGDCICSNCGYRKKHKGGVPCSKIKCPKCGKTLERK